jgi:hypothetical protein
MADHEARRKGEEKGCKMNTGERLVYCRSNLSPFLSTPLASLRGGEAPVAIQLFFAFLDRHALYEGSR